MASAPEFFERAMQVLATDPPLAYRLLVSAAQADPTLRQVWFEMAAIQANSGMRHAAIASWHRAIAGRGPDDLVAKSLVNIGHRYYQLGDFDAGWEWTQKAIAANPKNAYPWENLCAICIQRGEVDEAVEYARIGFDLSQEPVTEVALALALLNAGQWAEGLKHFQARFPYSMHDVEKHPHPKWDGKPVRQLLVIGEQGLGDTLSFARFVPWAARRADELVLSVQAELVRLLAPAMPHNVTFAAPTQRQTFHPADAYIPIMSLPVALGMDDRHIAECADLNYDVVVSRPKTGRLRVGISWAGSAANMHNAWRSIPFPLLLEWAAIPGVDLVSLQVGAEAEDVRKHGADALVEDVSHYLKDAAMTAEYIATEIDLVVTIDSFLGHLCGSIGVPCWVMVASKAGDWRLGRHGDKPALWYHDTHLVFRQGQEGLWGPVIAEVGKKLTERLEK